MGENDIIRLKEARKIIVRSINPKRNKELSKRYIMRLMTIVAKLSELIDLCEET